MEKSERLCDDEHRDIDDYDGEDGDDDDDDDNNGCVANPMNHSDNIRFTHFDTNNIPN